MPAILHNPFVAAALVFAVAIKLGYIGAGANTPAMLQPA